MITKDVNQTKHLLFFKETQISGNTISYRLARKENRLEISVRTVFHDGSECHAVLSDLSEPVGLCAEFVRRLYRSKSDPRALFELWEDFPKE